MKKSLSSAFRVFRKRLFVAIALGLFLCPLVQAHIQPVSVVVDTDMALDDMRALIMLLNSGAAEIRLIATSDGACSPQAGCLNAAMLLKYFNQERTVVAKGKESEKPAPPWRFWSEDVHWPDAADLPEQHRECRPAGAAMEMHGGLNPGYFAQIRRVAIRYWRDLDRRHIFDEHTGTVGDKGP